MIVGMGLISQRRRYPVTRVPIGNIRNRVISRRYESKHPKYPSIVYFCGIDGCGKTTQTVLLKRDLDRLKLPCRHVNLRWAAFFSWPFYAVCRVLRYTKCEQNIYGTWIKVHYFYRNKALSKIFPWLFMIDLTLRTHLVIKPHLRRGSVILCDRSSIDGLIDVMADTHDFDLWNKFPGRMLLSLILPNSPVFLLDLDELKAFGRKTDTPSLEFIMIRRKLFLELGNRFGFSILNADKPQDKLHSEIVELLAQEPVLFFNSLN